MRLAQKRLRSTAVLVSYDSIVWKNNSSATECARNCDLYELVSCHKFVNEKLFSIIYKTLHLTWGHHALGVILCLCLNFFWVISSWIVFAKPYKLKKLGVQYFCLWGSGCARVCQGTPGSPFWRPKNPLSFLKTKY